MVITYINKECTIITAIDFRKAYHFIRREYLIEILKEYRMPEKVIEFIADIYIEDKTRIKLGKEKYIEMNIQNGIRQGCTASTVLFKLITYKIFEELEHKCKGIIYGRRNMMCLFFADDGLLISNNFDQGCHLFLKTWKCSCKKKFVLEF